jgi:hypothetical protein
MINKILLLLLALSVTAGSLSSYKGSTLGPTVIVGAIIKASHEPDTFKKYARKDCPVCKGTGKYLSGDGINMSDCGYCEPEKKSVYIEAVEETKNLAPVVVLTEPVKKVITNSTKTNSNNPVTILPCPTCKPPVIRNANPSYYGR